MSRYENFCHSLVIIIVIKYPFHTHPSIPAHRDDEDAEKMGEKSQEKNAKKEEWKIWLWEWNEYSMAGERVKARENELQGR
jgi:hypothetical protein